MKKTLILSMTMLCFASIYSKSGGDFFASFAGGATGAMIGNAISQPRRSECHYYQPAPQTRVVEVHRPTYIQVEKPRKKHAVNPAHIDQKMQELENRSRELEIKTLQADLAKVQAENEQLKLRLQKYDMAATKK